MPSNLFKFRFYFSFARVGIGGFSIVVCLEIGLVARRCGSERKHDRERRGDERRERESEKEGERERKEKRGEREKEKRERA